jgi:hypothetical protein
MKIWTVFWAYWKWFCTALVTSTAILLVVATVIQQFKSVKVDQQKLMEQCIDKGGAWDDDAGACKSSA